MSVSVGIEVWLLGLFLMLITVSGAISHVQCNSTDRGSCSSVQVQDCSNGPHGCAASAELNTTKLEGRSCSQERSCNMAGPSATSRATNVSVVLLPNSDSVTFDLRVHWDNSNPDDIPMGYEVLFRDERYIVHCACQKNATIRQVTFKPVYTDNGAYRVEVISLPYQSRSNAAVVHFKLPSPCTGFTYNQYCQGGGLRNTSTWVTAETFRIMAGVNVPPQDTGQLLLKLAISWVGHFLVALADTTLADPTSSSEAISSCYTEGRDPPCFVVRDTSSVVIYPLNASRQYKVYVESFIANACGPFGEVPRCDTCRCPKRVRNSSATTVLPVLSTGPTQALTLQAVQQWPSSITRPSSTFIHLSPTSSTSVHPLSSPPNHPSASQSRHSSHLTIPTHIPKSPTGVAVKQDTRTHTSTLFLAGIHPTTTTTSWYVASSVSASRVPLSSTSDLSSSTGPVGPAVGGAVGIVVAVLFFTVTVVTLCHVILWRNKKSENSTNSKNPGNNVSFLSYPASPTPELPSPDSCSEGFNLPPANLELQLSSLSHCIVSPNPPLPSPPPAPPKPKPPFARSALIIYSPLCPDKDRRILMQYLIKDLMKYEIRPVSHDCDYTNGSLPQWLETEVKRASAVLCVCDPAFQQEWDQRQPSGSNFPLVNSLKLLIYANVNREEELSKYAIVLLREEDRNCIPTLYLHNTRKFYVNEVENIAHFVHQVPTYSFV